MEYRRILVPMKLDPGDANILVHAGALARLAGASVTLAHVAHTHSRDAAAVLNDEAEAYLEEQAAALRAQDLEVDVLVLDGEPSEGIRQAAERTGADLIVMGSHGHSQVRHVLLGSVTERVIRNGDTAVLLVRP